MTASSNELTAHLKSSIHARFDEQNFMRMWLFHDLNLRAKRLSASLVTFGWAFLSAAWITQLTYGDTQTLA